jgi:hypothetical protein
MNIERIGNVNGRWAKYNLIVDGVDIGSVQRTFCIGHDALNKTQLRVDGWKIHGVKCDTREDAEAQLIARAQRFGHIQK